MYRCHMRMRTFNLGLISKYRAELMGIATILIIICHMPAHGVAMPSWLESIIVHGGSGCDMFLFLSGMGIYRSYDSRKINCPNAFIKWLSRRYLRIFVPYLLIALPCLTIEAFNNHLTVWQFLLQLSTMSFWIDGKGLWFLALLLILYLITPILHVLVENQKRWFFILLILATWATGSIVGLQGPAAHIQFGLCRIPCYLIGFMSAKEIFECKKVKMSFILLPIFLGLVVCAVLNKATCFRISYFWIEGLFLLLVFAFLLEKLSQLTKLMAFCKFMGSISLESYCTNVLLLSYFHGLPFVIMGVNLNPGNWTYYILGTIVCLIVSYIVNRFSKWILAYGTQKNK